MIRQKALMATASTAAAKPGFLQKALTVERAARDPRQALR